MEKFQTTYQKDFYHPQIIPLITKPPKPPEWTKTDCDFKVPATESQANCSRNPLDPAKQKLADLKLQEDKLLRNFLKLNEMRRDMEIALLEHECASPDDMMKTIYEMSYSNKEVPIVPYRAFKPDTDDSCPIPIKPLKTALNNGYRDPFSFRRCAVRPAPQYRSSTDVCQGSSFPSTKRQVGDSEYMGTISRSGYRNLMAMQQYREPRPSSRRRFDGQCSV